MTHFLGPRREALLGRPVPVGKTLMVQSMSRSLVKFLKTEDGPTAVEYAVMLALIIVVCLTAISTLGNNANSTFGTVGNSIGAASS